MSLVVSDAARVAALSLNRRIAMIDANAEHFSTPERLRALRELELACLLGLDRVMVPRLRRSTVREKVDSGIDAGENLR